MKRDESFFLGDIIESIEAIEEFSKGLTKEELMPHRLKRDAIVRNVEIIGEAVKNISKNIKEKYPKVEWRKIASLFNLFDINSSLVNPFENSSIASMLSII